MTVVSAGASSARNPSANTLWRRIVLLGLIVLLGACQQTVAPLTAPSAAPQKIAAGDSDHRAYRYFELPNRLRVLLISAPNADKAAAALDINVGSAQDPRDRPGLAHFLEHMLFLGTDKYPQADEYQSFIAAHGGSHNAFTAFEHTNYFFDIDSAQLEPALDRFARFFVAPLFSAEYVEREKHAVDSEYRANIQSDRHRELDVLREVANPQHPFSQFSVGSLDTLADRGPADQGRADKPGQPVRSELLDFYQRNYSANLMTLVVIGREPLDQLQQMVATRFAAVPNRARHIDPITVPLFAQGSLPQLVQIQPVQQQRTLTLIWPLPDQRADYRGKSLEYIGNILGHEGAGSLLSELKLRGWAQSLGAGRGLDYDGGTQFSIGIELTPEGDRHRDEIVELAYQAIRRIRDGGIAAWLYREQQLVAEQRFRFREIPDPIGEVSQLAGNLHDYPAADVIRGDYLMEQFEPDRIRALLDQLTPGNMQLTATSPDAVTDRSSTYYSTPYSVAPLSPQLVQRWSNASLNPALRLPEPNLFIADNLQLKPLQTAAKKPSALRDGNGLHLWFLQDSVYRLPKASVALDVQSPLAGDSAEHAVLSELLVRVLRENLNEFSYPAQLAGLDYDISRSGRGITLRVRGFDQKQAVLLQRMLAALREPQIEARLFARVRDEYGRQLADNNKRPPYELLLGELGNALVRERWSDSTLLPYVKQASADKVRLHARALLAQIDIDMLVYGNVSAADAEALGAVVQQNLLAQARPATLPPVQILHAADRDYRRTVAAPHDDAALVWYRQAADLQKSTRAALGVSAQLIGTDFYAQLRTEQQLGYIVMASVYPLRDVPGLIFVAQSPVGGPAQLEKAYRDFLQQWAQRTPEQLRPLFERHRAALAQRLGEAPKNMAEAADRLWQDLSSDYLGFDSREQILDAVNALTFEQWLALFRRDVLAPEGHALWLAANGKFGKAALQHGTAIDDLDRFKSTQAFYPFK